MKKVDSKRPLVSSNPPVTKEREVETKKERNPRSRISQQKEQQEPTLLAGQDLRTPRSPSARDKHCVGVLYHQLVQLDVGSQQSDGSSFLVLETGPYFWSRDVGDALQ